ncbi:MAG TPA: phosphopantetheine-binding protein [Minicystis sp.]|nr:phosphopantetheine-binding protein [Minicystis sp.]
MNDLRATVLDALHRIAPEVDPSTLAPDAPIRDALDLDSMDFLAFVGALHRALDVDIPERDYRQVLTVESAVEYLRRKVGASS